MKNGAGGRNEALTFKKIVLYNIFIYGFAGGGGVCEFESFNEYIIGNASR
ncbi:hypothetical protein QY96_02291 [Bacillus thermotolerans]|nr:hypothetical protein QY96_02291 [Bacillus thermotolerans]